MFSFLSECQFYHKWAVLTDPDDTAGSCKGYIKCDISIITKVSSKQVVICLINMLLSGRRCQNPQQDWQWRWWHRIVSAVYLCKTSLLILLKVTGIMWTFLSTIKFWIQIAGTCWFQLASQRRDRGPSSWCGSTELTVCPAWTPPSWLTSSTCSGATRGTWSAPTSRSPSRVSR